MNIGVYIYRDAEGQPLYVGQTANLAKRDHEHWQRSGWRPMACSVETLSVHATRREALAAERAAIKAHAPAYNVAHNGVPIPRTRSVDPPRRSDAEVFADFYALCAELAKPKHERKLFGLGGAA